MPLPSFAELKAKKATPQISTKTITVPVKRQVKVATQSALPTPSRSKPRSTETTRHNTSSRQSSASSASLSSGRPSKTPVNKIRHERVRRPSPSSSTQHFTESDEDEEDDTTRARKRPRVVGPVGDSKRQIWTFDQSNKHEADLPLVHAFDIANNTLTEHGRDKYGSFFTALTGDEEEDPVILLQYPGLPQGEKYQLVKPNDSSDFKPIDEIEANMKLVAEYYLSPESALRVHNEEDDSGLVSQFHQHARQALNGRAGHQQKCIDIIEQFNNLVRSERINGTLADRLKGTFYVPPRLVDHIVKGQIYARIVSPEVHRLRQYESFSNNVYGEMLPEFVRRVFRETQLKSDHVFVDLGSGVGNTVLQAALEIGCESWGCEIMDSPSALAQLQANEFSTRCHLWGIKPGTVRLLRDDFLKNDELKRVLSRGDVVLINNQAFEPELNDKLKMMFLDLKEGCQIVSLKCFRDPTDRIKDTNINDPMNILTVQAKDRFSGMVSWTDDPGKWYLHKKDSRPLLDFNKKHFRSS